jgi:hypothetical protein
MDRGPDSPSRPRLPFQGGTRAGGAGVQTKRPPGRGPLVALPESPPGRRGRLRYERPIAEEAERLGGALSRGGDG